MDMLSGGAGEAGSRKVRIRDIYNKKKSEDWFFKYVFNFSYIKQENSQFSLSKAVYDIQIF